jgi:hypothetical protein
MSPFEPTRSWATENISFIEKYQMIWKIAIDLANIGEDSAG